MLVQNYVKSKQFVAVVLRNYNNVLRIDHGCRDNP